MPDDGQEALDAYSAVVTAVASAVLPSVASLTVHTRRGDGGGSASVITADGYLLTSAHVVAGAGSAEATFTDGTTVAAAGAIVGAVMKATRGQADPARVRELVLAACGQG